MLGLGPEYLYLITVLDLRPERHDAPVDLRPDRLVAKIGMHRIGEIHRRRTARKLDQLPLRGEGEHLSLEHGEPGVLQQFLRTCRMIEDFQQVLKPGVVVALWVGALLVSPMGEIGRASCRERECQYDYRSGVA